MRHRTSHTSTSRAACTPINQLPRAAVNHPPNAARRFVATSPVNNTSCPTSTNDNGWNRQASPNSARPSANTARVIPQPGHEKPNKSRDGHSGADSSFGCQTALSAMPTAHTPSGARRAVTASPLNRGFLTCTSPCGFAQQRRRGRPQGTVVERELQHGRSD
jgi:hypothetical protein